jgi:hypothetical protein
MIAKGWSWLLGAALAAAIAWAPQQASAQPERQLAPGFTALPAGAKLVLMPTDVELFSMSAGGVLEPQAPWTEAANKHIRRALADRFKAEGRSIADLPEASMTEEINELSALYGVVAQSIAIHQFYGGKLPTKDEKLDWTLGSGTQAIAKATGAQYGLFIFMRDSYASAERKAMMVGMALLGIGIAGGVQVGYASLVDLQTGRVVWFNTLASGFGDVREIEPARNTVSNLLRGLPN